MSYIEIQVDASPKVRIESECVTIEEVFEELIEPALLAMGYSQISIDEYFCQEVNHD